METDNTPDFRRIWEALILLAIGIALQLMLCGCSTHKTLETILVDSIKSVHNENVNSWANICQTDTFFKERLVTVTLNTNGDTVKEKEYIYIRDKSAIKVDTGNVKETSDTSTYKTKYIERKSQTSMSAWDAVRLNTWIYVFLIALFGLLFGVIIIYKKVIYK